MIIIFCICCVIIIKMYYKFTINILKIKFFIMSSDIIVKYFIELIDIDIVNGIFCVKTFIIFLTIA